MAYLSSVLVSILCCVYTKVVCHVNIWKGEFFSLHFSFFFLMFTAFRLNVFVFPYVHFRVSKLSSQKKKKNWIGIGLILNVYIDFREETYFSYEVSLSKSRMSLCLFGSSMPYSFYIAVGYILVTLIPGYFLCCRYKNGAIGSECLLCEALCWMLGLQQ